METFFFKYLILLSYSYFSVQLKGSKKKILKTFWYSYIWMNKGRLSRSWNQPNQTFVKIKHTEFGKERQHFLLNPCIIVVCLKGVYVLPFPGSTSLNARSWWIKTEWGRSTPKLLSLEGSKMTVRVQVGFESLQHWLAGWPWANHSNFLNPRILICNLELMVPIHQVVWGWFIQILNEKC